MQLNLLEKFIFLAHHPYKARFRTSEFQISYGLMGAILLDLSDKGKIDIRNDRLIVNSLQDITNPVSARIAEKILYSGKEKDIKYWISKLGRNIREEKKLVMASLRQKGLLKQERRKALWLFPYTVDLVADIPAYRRLTNNLLQKALHPHDVTTEETMLLGLVESCKLHHALTAEKSQLKQVKRSLKSFLLSDPIAASVDKTVKEVQTAIIVTMMTATMTSTITATSVSTS